MCMRCFQAHKKPSQGRLSARWRRRNGARRSELRSVCQFAQPSLGQTVQRRRRKELRHPAPCHKTLLLLMSEAATDCSFRQRVCDGRMRVHWCWRWWGLSQAAPTPPAAARGSPCEVQHAPQHRAATRRSAVVPLTGVVGAGGQSMPHKMMRQRYSQRSSPEVRRRRRRRRTETLPPRR